MDRRLDNTLALARHNALRLLPATRDATVASVAEVFSLMVEQMQTASPDTCWGYFHFMPTDLRLTLTQPVLDAMAKAEQQVHDDTKGDTPPVDRIAQRQVLQSLYRTIRSDGREAALAGLRSDGHHDRYCPAISTLAATARALPEPARGQALRALLVGG